MSVSFGDDRVVREEDGVGPALRPGQLGEDDAGHATWNDHSYHALIKNIEKFNI